MDEQNDFLTWYRSLGDTEQERVLIRLRTAATAVLAKHAQNVLTQPAQRNVFSAN